MKSKTRFVCDLPGQTSELLSVKENPGGSLTLFLKTGGRYIPDALWGEDSLITGHKISIHRSNKGVDTTIHHTLILEGDIPLDSAAYQKSSAEDLIWPLFYRACPDLSKERFAVNRRKNDEIIVAATLNEVRTSLLCCAVVSSKGLGFGQDSPFPPSTASFEYFDISLFCAHLWGPAIPSGTYFHQSTNAPRVKGEFVLGDWRGLVPTSTLSPDEVVAQINEGMEIARASQVAKIEAFMTSPEQISMLKHYPMEILRPTAPPMNSQAAD